MNGILPLWKPKGFTSHDCVMKIRKLLKTKKVGHTGTLDPEVEGVLPLCIGQATKIVPYLTDTKKTYVAEITLGYSTETEDSQGKVIETRKLTETISDKRIMEVFELFKGEVTQIPPMYSAVKVKGKKLYEYAREGKTVERPERTIYIDELELLSNEGLGEVSYQRFSFRVVCSKGTYIRTLCVDLGLALDKPAHMSDLVRVQTGSFHANDTFTFEEIERAVEEGQVESVLSPIQAGVDHLDVIHIDRETFSKVLNGQKLPILELKPKTNPFRVEFQNELVAIYQFHPENNEEIKPVRVFQINAESR